MHSNQHVTSNLKETGAENLKNGDVRRCIFDDGVAGEYGTCYCRLGVKGTKNEAT